MLCICSVRFCVLWAMGGAFCDGPICGYPILSLETFLNKNTYPQPVHLKFVKFGIPFDLGQKNILFRNFNKDSLQLQIEGLDSMLPKIIADFVR